MKTRIPLKIIKIDDSGYHLAATIILNGLPARVVIDTGASHSVFDKERIKKFLNEEKIKDVKKLSSGLGTNTMKSQEARIYKMELGKIVLKNHKLVLLDLSHVIRSYESIGKKAIDGVIGSDILKRLNAVIDFSEKSLTISQKKR